MTLVTFLLQRSQRLLAGSLLTGFACGLASVWLLATINHLLRGPGQRRGFAVLATYLALVLVTIVSKSLSVALLARLVQSAVHHLRVRLADALVHVPLRRLEEMGAGRLFGVLTDDVQAVANGLTIAPIVLINGVLVAGCVVYLAWLSWPLALGVAATVALWLGGTVVPASMAASRLRQARVEQDQVMISYRGLIDGNKELKLNRARCEEILKLDFLAPASRVRDLQIQGMTALAGALGWGQSLAFVLIAVVLFGFGADPAVSPVVLVVLFMMGPMEALVLQIPAVMRSRIALQRLDELTSELPAEDLDVSTPTAPPPRLLARLEARDAAYAYRTADSDSQFRLGPIEFAIAAGEIVFVIGGNGSGKSTFMKLLAGLYPLDAGELRWDGRLVTADDMSAYRTLFSAVFADVYLFHRLPPAPVDSHLTAEHYLRRLHLDQIVTIRNGCFSTVALSQGQRHRLALVCAYLEDRPVYLFDEWAASQDPEFRRVFYRELLPELKSRGKAVVVVSHDEEFYDVADRLVRLHDGRIEPCYETSLGMSVSPQIGRS